MKFKLIHEISISQEKFLVFWTCSEGRIEHIWGWIRAAGCVFLPHTYKSMMHFLSTSFASQSFTSLVAYLYLFMPGYLLVILVAWSSMVKRISFLVASDHACGVRGHPFMTSTKKSCFWHSPSPCPHASTWVTRRLFQSWAIRHTRCRYNRQKRYRYSSTFLISML